jgi:uncharacterized protein involved in outer membrane biogenesis
MRRFIKIFLLILVFIMVGVALIPLLVPMESIKGIVQTRLESATGRKVTMDNISLSVFPTIALKGSNVRIANPAWVAGGDMVSIKSLKLGVELMPLLDEEVRIKELILDEPLFILIKQDGKESWQFEKEAPVNAPKKSASSKEGGASIVRTLSLGTITIKNGGLIYKDINAGTVQDFSDVNLRVKAPDPAKKIALDGNLIYNGKKVDIALSQETPLSMLAGIASNVGVKASYNDVTFSWQGTDLLKGNVPFLTGKITIDTIDVAALSQKKEKKVVSLPELSPASGGPVGHWSDSPINLEALKAVNADLDIAVAKIILPKTTLENINANLRLSNGNAHINTNDITVYGGTAKAEIDATSSNNVKISAVLTHINSEPLLHDFAGIDTVSGTISGKAVLTANGASEKAMVANLAGAGDFAFKDGKIKGKNFTALAQNIASSFNGANAETAFSSVTGSCTIAKGIVYNNDLKMESPAFKANGAGQTDLPNWQVHYVLTPLLVSGSIAVPIRIEGALDSPSYKPDVQAAITQNLKNPVKIKEGIKDLRKNLLNKDAINGLLR